MTDEQVDRLIIDVKALESGRTANHEDIAVLRSEFLGEVKAINDKLSLITSGQTPVCIQEQARMKTLEEKWNTEVTSIRNDVSRIDAHVTWIWRTVGSVALLAIASELYKAVIAHYAALLHP